MTLPVFLHPTPHEATVLDGPEGRHAVTVKRLRPGEQLTLVDGAGTWSVAEVTGTSGKDKLALRVRERGNDAAPARRITVVQALPKAEKGEQAIDLGTQVGVDAFVPWSSQRAIAKWTPSKGRKWEAAAVAAAKQARRSWIPQIAAPLDTAALVQQVAARTAAGDTDVFILHEEAVERLTGVGKLEHDAWVIVGPEGGIAPEELAALHAAGARPVLLGREVLRAVTAGAAASVVLNVALGRW